MITMQKHIKYFCSTVKLVSPISSLTKKANIEPPLSNFFYNNNLNIKDSIISKATSVFLNCKVELKHILNDRNINLFSEGIRNNSYKLYDKYINIPEILILGRSNVGKSTLINTLFNKTVTKPSKSPGKTQALEFFLINQKKKNLFFIIDSPGFGFVEGPKVLKDKFKYLVNTYLSHAVRLKLIVYLINGSYPIQKLDLQQIEYLNKFDNEIVLVFTKVDNFNDKNVISSIDYISNYTKQFKNVRSEILITSCRKMNGIENLRGYLSNEVLIKKKKESVVKELDITNLSFTEDEEV